MNDLLWMNSMKTTESFTYSIDGPKICWRKTCTREKGSVSLTMISFEFEISDVDIYYTSSVCFLFLSMNNRKTSLPRFDQLRRFKFYPRARLKKYLLIKTKQKTFSDRFFCIE